MSQPSLVRLTNITKHYRLGDVFVRALTDVSIDIDAGGFVALAGPSGSGKTTLLNLVGCIDKPDSGRGKLHVKVQKSRGRTASSRKQAPMSDSSSIHSPPRWACRR